MKILTNEKAIDGNVANIVNGPGQTIVGPGNVSEFSKNSAESGADGLSPMEEAVSAAFKEAEDEERRLEAEKSAGDASNTPAGADGVDVKGRVDSDPLLKSTPVSGMDLSPVSVTQEQKDAFIDSIVANDRYTEKFELFGGRVSATIRSRTLEETDAIESWLRRKVALDEIKTASDYGNAAREVLLAAQVAEVDGVSYDELKGPMRSTETPSGVKDPGWVEQAYMWGKKPVALCVALTRCIAEFEARYWYFVENAKDVNFWSRGESTAE